MKVPRAPLPSLLLLLAMVLLTPAAANAHGKLRSSTPAANARLSSAPTELRLTFSEATELALTRIDLSGPDSQLVALAPLAFADSAAHDAVVTMIRGALREGRYTISWQMVGADGHPVRGSFTFHISPGASGLATPSAAAVEVPGDAGASVPAPGQPTLPPTLRVPSVPADALAFDASSPLYVAIRWLTFAALVIVLGAVAFHHFVLGLLFDSQEARAPFVAPASKRAARFAVYATALLGVATLLRLYAQSYALHGAAGALDPASVGMLLGGTTWGWGWQLQVAACAVALAGFLAARGGRRSGWMLATIAAIVLAFTPALSGHAVAVEGYAPLAVLADGLHIIGAGAWLGTLFLVLAAGIPATRQLPEVTRGQGVAELVYAFSPTALIAAGIVAMTGIISAWLHMNAVSDLWQSDYGRTLLLKLGVLSIAAATGAYNWLRVRPALGNAHGTTRILRSATVELAAAVLVLAVTAVLVATPPPTDAMAASVGPHDPTATHGAVVGVTGGGAARDGVAHR